MADNYLERQRELYEARKAAWEKQKKYRKRKTNTHSSVSAPANPAEKKQSIGEGMQRTIHHHAKVLPVFLTGLKKVYSIE